MELDDDFQADVGVELYGLALPGEVKLDFLYIKIELKQSISWATLFGLDLELDFIIKNPIKSSCKSTSSSTSSRSSRSAM